LLQADYYEALGEKTRACELREAFVAYSLYSVRQLLEIEPGLIEIKETATATNDEALLNKMAQVERELKKTKRESGDLVARPIIQIALYYYDQGNYDEALRQLEALDSLGKHHSLSLGSYFYYMRLQEALRNRIKSIHC
jgi:tetratricopeptide (TPR) repeat protein